MALILKGARTILNYFKELQIPGFSMYFSTQHELSFYKALGKVLYAFKSLKYIEEHFKIWFLFNIQESFHLSLRKCRRPMRTQLISDSFLPKNDI